MLGFQIDAQKKNIFTDTAYSGRMEYLWDKQRIVNEQPLLFPSRRGARSLSKQSILSGKFRLFTVFSPEISFAAHVNIGRRERQANQFISMRIVLTSMISLTVPIQPRAKMRSEFV